MITMNSTGAVGATGAGVTGGVGANGGTQTISILGTESEAVNHPKHYGGENNPYEVIKVLRAWNLGFSLGNAIKYISRAGKKDPGKKIEDLRKALWYIQEEIDHELERSSR